MLSRQAAGDQVEIGRCRPRTRLEARGDVGDRVLERELLRDRRAGAARSRPPRRGSRRRPRAPSGGSKRAATGCPGLGSADDEAAVDRRGDVVGVPLELGRPRQELLLREPELVEMVGGEEAGDDRRRARAEAARQRDLAAQPEGDPVGRAQALEGADDQVVAAGRQPAPPGSKENSPASSTSSSRWSATAAAITS